MYILVFASAIKLRISKPDEERPYKIPGGLLGLCMVAGIGILTCFLTFGLGFVPPSQFKESFSLNHLFVFEGYLILGLLLFSLPALFCGKHFLRESIHN
jgi:amino acid transporter